MANKIEGNTLYGGINSKNELHYWFYCLMIKYSCIHDGPWNYRVDNRIVVYTINLCQQCKSCLYFTSGCGDLETLMFSPWDLRSLCSEWKQSILCSFHCSIIRQKDRVEWTSWVIILDYFSTTNKIREKYTGV